MYIKELIRLRSQHKTLCCYVILSIWIFLLILGKSIKLILSVTFINVQYFSIFLAMYKYVGAKEDTMASVERDLNIKPLNFKSNEHHYRDCNFPENIKLGDEGGNLDGGWALQGVIVLTRNGMRGSMSHVNSVSNCDADEDDLLLNKYRNFVQNLSAISNSSGWSKLGPFHGFPILPATPKACYLGQLTSKGVSQMLKVGEILRNAYMHNLALYQKTLVKPLNNSDIPVFDSEEIVIYSTRYRRTFQ